MNSRIHMQDQVTNRIEELMCDKHAIDWNDVLQNIVTATIVSAFFMLGLNW